MSLPHPDDLAAREALAKRPQPSLEKVLAQAKASQQQDGDSCHYCDEQEADCGRHGPSPWIPADKELPGNPRCVLATDGEAHFIAVYEVNPCEGKNCAWINAHTGDEIDSHVTHWMELPEVPNE